MSLYSIKKNIVLSLRFALMQPPASFSYEKQLICNFLHFNIKARPQEYYKNMSGKNVSKEFKSIAAQKGEDGRTRV